MSRRVTPAACALLTAALVAAPGLAAAAPAPSPSAPASLHQVPPPAPSPTAHAKSPGAPDPNPPLGGIGPLGEPVGGKALLNRGLIVPHGSPALPQGINAQSWILVNLDSGDVLAAQDPHGRYQPASILKTLLSITVLPLLPAHKTITVAGTEHSEGSLAGLVDGGQYTTDELFEALLLVSGNDCADALAVAAGGRAHTVALMNRTAMAIGAYDTYVQTPSGLDGWQQLTSAYDMSLFLRAAVDNPRFVEYDRRPTVTLPQVNLPDASYGALTLTNQSLQFLTTVPGALVVKTGFTDAAQHTYLAAIKRGNTRLGVILLRGQQYPVGMRQQAVNLMNWGFALPANTPPVGHLDPAVTIPTAARSSTAKPVAAQPVAGRHRSSMGTILALLGAVLLLLGVGTAKLLRRLKSSPAAEPAAQDRAGTAPRH